MLGYVRMVKVTLEQHHSCKQIQRLSQVSCLWTLIKCVEPYLVLCQLLMVQLFGKIVEGF